MADIVAAEIKFYKSTVVSGDASNGGPIDETAEVPDSVGGSSGFWSVVFASERAAGSEYWRKEWVRIENSDDKVLANAFVYVKSPTISQYDKVVFIDADSIATQGNIVGSEPFFGAGGLDATVTAGATSVDVLVETGSPIIFRDADNIVIADSVNAESRLISGAPTNIGDVWTLTLDTPLINGYSSTDSYVSSALSLGSVKGSFQNPVVSSAAGLFDHLACTVHSIGAVDDTITIQFTSATGFDVSGAIVGSLGSGNVGTPFAPTNPNTGTAYFTIPTAAWSGTFATADQVTVDMDAATFAIFARKTLDAGAAVVGGNSVTISVLGESVDP